MIVRKYLETLRDEIRALKWMADKAGGVTNDVKLKAAWCSDYASELLDHLDDDVVMRSSVSLDCTVEIRYSRRPKNRKETKALFKMAEMLEEAFDDAPDKDASAPPAADLRGPGGRE